MSDVVIRGGEIVTPVGRQHADIRVADGLIRAIEPEIRPAVGDEVIEADGLFVLPGIVDCHTHFELDTGKMQTRDDFASGSMSAAAGGVTTFINFAPQQRGQSLLDAIRQEQSKARSHTVVDYALHLSFGTPGPDWRVELQKAVDLGVSSIKVYTTYTDTIYYTRDWDWYQLMQHSRQAGMLVMVHAENDDILRGQTEELLAQNKKSFRYHGVARPAIAETEAVARGLAFCRATGSPIYFVHLSSPASVALVERARVEGLPAYAEVCAHHISLNDALYETNEASRYVMTPPLRSDQAVRALREQVVAGDVEAISSDHCGYSLDQRGGDRDFTAASPGIPGVETLWPMVYTTLVASGLASLESAVNLVSWNPAVIFGLTPRKGALAPGADADIVLYDPTRSGPLDETSLHSRAAYSPWHGQDVQGRVVRTISRGTTVYNDGRVLDNLQHGQFVPCAPFQHERVKHCLAVPGNESQH